MDIDSVHLMFPKNSDCVAFLEQVRWAGKPTCPHCNRKSSTPIRNEYRHHCNVCNLTFSVTAKTVFHGTRLPLQKWFLAVGLMMRSAEDPSVRELAAMLQVNKNTASYIATRIRRAYMTELNLLLAVTTEVLKGDYERKDT